MAAPTVPHLVLSKALFLSGVHESTQDTMVYGVDWKCCLLPVSLTAGNDIYAAKQDSSERDVYYYLCIARGLGSHYDKRDGLFCLSRFFLKN